MIRSFAIALAAAALLLGLRVATVSESSPPPWDAKPFEAPTNGVDRALLLHDGQTYAAIAQDPTLRDSSRFYGDEREQAYRAGRPLLPWLAWVGSLGQAAWVPEALVVLSALGVAAMVAAAAVLGGTLGRDPSKAWLVLLLPGSLAAMTYVGLTDALATAGVLAGFALWTRGDHRLAVVVFAAAILTRETGLLAVAALLVVQRGKARSLLLAPVPYVLWLVYVRLQLGSWSFAASSSGARYTTPFAGWWRAARHGDVVWWAVLAVTVAVVALGWRHLPRVLRWFAALWVLSATCFGWQVWWKAFDYPRVLLPLTVVAMLPLLPASPKPAEREGAPDPAKSGHPAQA